MGEVIGLYEGRVLERKAELERAPRILKRSETDITLGTEKAGLVVGCYSTSSGRWQTRVVRNALCLSEEAPEYGR